MVVEVYDVLIQNASKAKIIVPVTVYALVPILRPTNIGFLWRQLSAWQ